MTVPIILLIDKILHLHDYIARESFPNGVSLTCKDCGYAAIATTEECARYLASGWPTHHGKSMLLDPVNIDL